MKIAREADCCTHYTSVVEYSDVEYTNYVKYMNKSLTKPCNTIASYLCDN
jgi:hypothetical protein